MPDDAARRSRLRRTPGTWGAIAGVISTCLLSAAVLVFPSSGPVASAATSLQSLVPARLMETRSGPDAATVDGLELSVGPLAAGEVRAFVVAGRGGVSADPDSVLLNVTAAFPAAAGFLTVFPCGGETPAASTVNYGPGGAVANAVLAKVGSGGRVCVYSLAPTDVVVDVNGFVPAGGAPQSVVPARLMETRSGPGNTTRDGRELGQGRIAAGSVRGFTVLDRGGVAPDADAVLLNVAAVSPSAPGFLTVFPCGGEVPTASSVNYGPGDVVANAALSKVGADGRVCIFSLAETDVVVDVSGFVPAGGDPRSLVPVRLLETRTGAGATTIDGRELGAGPIAAGTTREFVAAGRGGVTGDADSLVLNVTAVFPLAPGYLTVFPCGGAVPATSSVNYGRGGVVANTVLAKVGTGGKVCVFSLATTHVVVDVDGFVPSLTNITVKGTAVAPVTTSAPTGPPPPGGPFARITTTRGVPIRWDPCRAGITYAIDPTRADQRAIDEFDLALARLEQATGLDFRFAGTYLATYDQNGYPSRPSNADVGVTFADNDIVELFDSGVLGFALPSAAPSTGQIGSGTITIDITPGDRFERPLIWLHELGHLVGLEHIDRSIRGELMAPFYDGALTGYGPGDLEGMWNVGVAQPCFPKAFSSSSSSSRPTTSGTTTSGTTTSHTEPGGVDQQFTEMILRTVSGA